MNRTMMQAIREFAKVAGYGNNIKAAIKDLIRYGVITTKDIRG